MRSHLPDDWRVVAIADTEEQALYYAQDKFWNAYVAAKTGQLREWTEQGEAREALAKKLYSQVHLEGTSFTAKSRPGGDQVLHFTLTVANDTDYLLEYADGLLELKDEVGNYTFSASFSTRENKKPVPPHSSASYNMMIVFDDLKNLGGNKLVTHYKTGLELLEKGKIPYSITLSLAEMLKGDNTLGIRDSGALPPRGRNPDTHPDYEFSNETALSKDIAP